MATRSLLEELNLCVMLEAKQASICSVCLKVLTSMTGYRKANWGSVNTLPPFLFGQAILRHHCSVNFRQRWSSLTKGKVGISRIQYLECISSFLTPHFPVWWVATTPFTTVQRAPAIMVVSSIAGKVHWRLEVTSFPYMAWNRHMTGRGLLLISAIEVCFENVCIR